MKSSFRSLLISLVLPFALAPAGRAAPATPSSATYSDTAAPARPPLVSIDFPGGSLTKFLATIAQDNRVSFNIIGVGEATDFSLELPPFSLRNAELHVVAAVLRELLQPRGFELIPIGGQPDSFVCTMRRIPPPPPATYYNPPRFESYQLAPYLTEQSVDDIVGAIRAAWELDPAHQPDALRLKFHPATSLLLAAGPLDAIIISQQVLTQLKRTPEKQPKPVPTPGAPAASKP